MLRPLDRERRDGPLYPGSSRTLRDCFDRQHLLVRIDAAFDFAPLVADLTALYHPRTGRPAIHPEVVLRALLLAGLYGVLSNRELCQRISENLAWRWFCHLRLDDAVVDHSTLSVFLDRVGSAGLRQIFAQLNQALADAGLLSQRTYLDSSLIPANVRTADLTPRDPADDPPLPAGEPDDVFVARQPIPEDRTAPASITLLRYQDEKGRLPLPWHDRDCRWRTVRRRTVLGYKEHLLADRSGFILARRSTPATTTDVAGALPLLEQSPVPLRSLTADTGYCAGRFRHLLHRRGITAYIPIPRTQDVTAERFVDHFDHFVCPAGKRLLPRSVPDEDQSIRYAARAADCRPCPLRQDCGIPSSRAAKVLWASQYRITYPRARQLNATARAAREQRRRTTVAEGIFALLDRLGGTRARYRGLERMECHGTLVAMAHNIRKAMTKRRFFRCDAGILPPPVPTVPSIVRLLISRDTCSSRTPTPVA